MGMTVQQTQAENGKVLNDKRKMWSDEYLKY